MRKRIGMEETKARENERTSQVSAESLALGEGKTSPLVVVVVKKVRLLLTRKCTSRKGASCGQRGGKRLLDAACETLPHSLPRRGELIEKWLKKQSEIGKAETSQDEEEEGSDEDSEESGRERERSGSQSSSRPKKPRRRGSSRP
jgi:hypothetical protein